METNRLERLRDKTTRLVRKESTTYTWGPHVVKCDVFQLREIETGPSQADLCSLQFTPLPAQPQFIQDYGRTSIKTHPFRRFIGEGYGDCVGDSYFYLLS